MMMLQDLSDSRAVVHFIYTIYIVPCANSYTQKKCIAAAGRKRFVVFAGLFVFFCAIVTMTIRHALVSWSWNE